MTYPYISAAVIIAASPILYRYARRRPFPASHRSPLAKLARDIKKAAPGLLVASEGVTLQIKFPQQHIFRSEGDNIEKAPAVLLLDIAAVMEKHKGINYFVNGYTYGEGAEEFNFNLSQRRAEAVRKMMIIAGIEENRILAVGMGDGGAAGKMSRTVDIICYPIKTLKTAEPKK